VASEWQRLAALVCPYVAACSPASGTNANAAATTAKAEIGSARAPGVIAETAHDLTRGGSWLSRRGSQPEARAHRTRPLRLAWPSWQATRASGLALRPDCLPPGSSHTRGAGPVPAAADSLCAPWPVPCGRRPLRLQRPRCVSRDPTEAPTRLPCFAAEARS